MRRVFQYGIELFSKCPGPGIIVHISCISVYIFQALVEIDSELVRQISQYGLCCDGIRIRAALDITRIVGGGADRDGAGNLLLNLLEIWSCLRCCFGSRHGQRMMMLISTCG